MRDSHRKIIEAVLEKAKTVPGGLDVLGIYGSAATGDMHERSDLDLLIVPTVPEDRIRFTHTFILDDEQIGYDIYCTSWDMLEEDAECRHANLGKLMDSEILFVRDDKARERIDDLRSRTKETLASEKRFSRAEEALQRSYMPFTAAITADIMADKRAYSAYVISLCLDAVMLYNGKYFRKGTKRTFEELQGLALPVSFEDCVMRIVKAEDGSDADKALTDLMRTVMRFLKREEKKAPPAAEELKGTYEEMVSNWRNKMIEAAENGDAYSSYINMAFLQFMLAGISEGCDIPEYGVMERFSPKDLKANADIFDGILDRYLEEYKKAGTEPNRYPNVDAFIRAYLKKN